MQPTSMFFINILCAFTASSAFAGPCDFRPSQLAGSGISGAAIGATAGTAAGAATAKAAGVYTLVHATTNLTMVGGTWAGASAAGTAGIIAGTGGVIGATVAAITAPATIAALAVAATAVGGFEAGCYFSDERVTNYDAIDALVYDISLSARENFIYVPAQLDRKNAYVKVFMHYDGTSKIYKNFNVDKLYLVNGVLYHRDFGPNTKLGHLGLIPHEDTAEVDTVDIFDAKPAAE